MVMPYHLHMPSYFLETFTEYPYSISSLILLIPNFPQRIYTCLKKSKQSNRSWVKHLSKNDKNTPYSSSEIISHKIN